MTTLPPGLIHATRNPDMTRVDMKVLIRLHESLSLAEFRPVRSWFVANLLQVDVSSVNRSLQHLEELGYVERGERCSNGNYGYRLTVPSNGDHSPPPMSSAA
jgi:predicted transcriptional regulator